ncbi:MAG: TIGR03067 domain-containing protein [Verrucomicrobia bacterium]|nr:TIGR03067 domain-containing protein [Verrucomicrobiota bacterium]
MNRQGQKFRPKIPIMLHGWLASISCISILLGAGCTAEKSSAKLETKKLQGTWQLIYQEGNGKKLPDEKTAEMLHGKMVFAGDKIHYSVELQGFDFEFAYKLHSDHELKEIDLQLTKTVDKQGIGMKTFGVYRLEDDTLKICYSKTNRPADFNAGEGSHNTLIVLKRKVPETQ